MEKIFFIEVNKISNYKCDSYMTIFIPNAIILQNNLLIRNYFIILTNNIQRCIFNFPCFIF